MRHTKNLLLIILLSAAWGWSWGCDDAADPEFFPGDPSLTGGQAEVGPAGEPLPAPDSAFADGSTNPGPDASDDASVIPGTPGIPDPLDASTPGVPDPLDAGTPGIPDPLDPGLPGVP